MAARAVHLLSYNVRYFGHALRGLASTRASKQLIAERISRLSPSPQIICLQEVETISIRSSIAYRRATARETQLQSFMGELEEAYARRGTTFPYQAYYFRAHTYRFRGVPIYTTGLAIIVNTRTFEVDRHNAGLPELITHHHVAILKDRKQSRICAHVRLKDDAGRPLHVFNTHLSLPTPFAREFWATREKMGFGVNQVHEAKSLASFVKRHAGNEPFVIAGDFNSPPGSPVYRYLTESAEFSGAQQAMGQIDGRVPKKFPTAGFMRLRMHLDHLFYGGGIRWLDLQGTRPFGDINGDFYGLSDHVPLIGCFELPRA